MAKMEPIGDILHQIQSRPESPSDTSSDEPFSREVIEECTCKRCGVTFLGTVTYYKVYPARPFLPRWCPACRTKAEREEEAERETETERERQLIRYNWLQTSGLPEDLKGKTFDNFVRGRNQAAYDATLAWATAYDLDNPRRYRSILLYSDQPGVGKTHLAAAVINYVIRAWQGDLTRRKRPVYFVKGPRLVRRIRATYNIREDDNGHEREDEVYAELAGVPLLVLDDVGKETPSRFTRETYWYLIDERITSGLPVIITSRLTLDGPNSLEEVMGEDTVDRIYGMVRGEAYRLRGQSYRRELGQP